MGPKAPRSAEARPVAVVLEVEVLAGLQRGGDGVDASLDRRRRRVDQDKLGAGHGFRRLVRDAGERHLALPTAEERHLARADDEALRYGAEPPRLGGVEGGEPHLVAEAREIGGDDRADAQQ